MNGDQQTKKEFRSIALSRRDAQPNRELSSEIIARQLLQFARARKVKTASCYVSIRSEVQTTGLIESWLAESVDVYVPFCGKDRLELFQINSLNQLQAGTLGIPEPPTSLRVPERKLPHASALDLIVVPGLAFTAAGDRLGYGQGYYDRLLAELMRGVKVGVCFECQLFDSLPAGPRDVTMDLIVTESRLLACRPDDNQGGITIQPEGSKTSDSSKKPS